MRDPNSPPPTFAETEAMAYAHAEQVLQRKTLGPYGPLLRRLLPQLRQQVLEQHAAETSRSLREEARLHLPADPDHPLVRDDAGPPILMEGSVGASLGHVPSGAVLVPEDIDPAKVRIDPIDPPPSAAKGRKVPGEPG